MLPRLRRCAEIIGAGWRIHFLGADVPVRDVDQAAATIGADLIVFGGAMPHTLYAVAGELVRIGKDHGSPSAESQRVPSARRTSG